MRARLRDPDSSRSPDMRELVASVRMLVAWMAVHVRDEGNWGVDSFLCRYFNGFAAVIARRFY